MKKENKNLWRRYEKNRPIIPNRQKQKRKSDRRKLHPQTKKKYRVYFFHSRGLKRIPHTRPQLHWRVLLLRAATLCCEYILHISEISLSFLSNYGPALNSVSNVFRPNATSVLVQRPRRKQTLCCGSQFKTEKSVFCSGEKYVKKHQIVFLMSG